MVEQLEVLTYEGPSADIEHWIETKNPRSVPFLHQYSHVPSNGLPDSTPEGWLLFLPYLRQTDSDWFRAVPNPAGSYEEASDWSQNYLRNHYLNHAEARPTPEG